MIRWPLPDRVSEVSQSVLEKLKKAGLAKELEQDPREWVLAGWPWVPDPPYTFVVRASDGEQRRLVLGEDGLWTMTQVERSSSPSAA
jgi:hypothetical protein